MMETFTLTDDRLVKILRGGSDDYANLTYDQAISNPIYSSCVGLIANCVSMLGLHVFQQDGDNKVAVLGDPIAALLKKQPNPYMSNVVFFELLVTQLLTRGNATARILRANDDSILGFLPLLWQNMRVDVADNGTVTYIETYKGKQRTHDARNILHMHMWSEDGVAGTASYQRFAKTVGWGLSLQKLSNDLASNGAIPPGIIVHPDDFDSPEQEKSFLKRFMELIRARRVPYLKRGMDYKSLGLAPEVLQYVESKHLNTEETCAIFHIPPVFEGVASAGLSFASMEVQIQALYVLAVLPVVRRIESEINRKVWPDSSRYLEFELGTLLRPDTQALYDALLKATGGKPIISQNEGRAKLNLPKVDGGDDLTPLNAAKPTPEGTDGTET